MNENLSVDLSGELFFMHLWDYFRIYLESWAGPYFVSFSIRRSGPLWLAIGLLRPDQTCLKIHFFLWCFKFLHWIVINIYIIFQWILNVLKRTSATTWLKLLSFLRDIKITYLECTTRFTRWLNLVQKGELNISQLVMFVMMKRVNLVQFLTQHMCTDFFATIRTWLTSITISFF